MAARLRATDQELLAALRRLAHLLGHTPSDAEINAASRRPQRIVPSAGVYRERWGTLRAAQRAAGLPANTYGRHRRYWTREHCLDALRTLAQRLGRPPLVLDVKNADRRLCPSYDTYRRRFGSLASALRALTPTLTSET